MAVCVAQGEGGVLVVDATPVEACTSFVLESAAEFAEARFFVPLTVEEGSAIGAAIFLAFTVAFGFRQLRKAVEPYSLNEGE